MPPARINARSGLGAEARAQLAVEHHLRERVHSVVLGGGAFGRLLAARAARAATAGAASAGPPLRTIPFYRDFKNGEFHRFSTIYFCKNHRFSKTVIFAKTNRRKTVIF